MTPAMIYTGETFTEQWEGYSLTPYQDSKGVWTDGYGNTHGVVPHGPPITPAKAVADLAANLQAATYAVNHYVAVHLTQDEFNALVDFTFNVGAGNFATSTMLRLVNSGDMAGASHEFEKWDMAGGRVVAGLLRRRIGEEDLFDKPDQA